MERDRRINARLSQAERELLERIAAAERVQPSEAVRIVLRGEGRRRGLWPPEAASGSPKNGGAGD